MEKLATAKEVRAANSDPVQEPPAQALTWMRQRIKQNLARLQNLMMVLSWVVEVELLDAKRREHRVKDAKLTSSNSADHHATCWQTH